MAFAKSYPANARRKALKSDARTGHVEPAVQVEILREQLLHGRVGAIYILGIPGQGSPAKRSHAPTEEGPDISGHKTRKFERAFYAFILRHLANIVAVIEDRYSLPAEAEHGVYVFRYRFACRSDNQFRLTDFFCVPFR